MKNFLHYTLASFVTFLCAIPVAYAQQYATPSTIYQRDFDVLLLDMTLPDNVGQQDILNAITLKNEGSGSSSMILNLNFWADQGQPGFQGFSIDKKLGTFRENQSIAGWSLSDLAETVPQGGLRVFVTADFASVSVDNRYFQVRPHQTLDLNANGTYDYGDYGMYFVSKNNNKTIYFPHELVNGQPPVAQSPTNQSGTTGQPVIVREYNQVTVRSQAGDYLPPRVVIENITNGISLDNGSNFLIKGSARDRQDGGIKLLQIRIDKDQTIGQWQDTTIIISPTNQNIYNWSYNWQNIVPGKYTITVKSEDWSGNRIELAPLILTIAPLNQSPAETQTPPSVPTQPQIPTQAPNQTQTPTQIIDTTPSQETSTIEVNRTLVIRAPKEDRDVYAKITIRNKAGQPLPGKLITMKAMRPGKDTPSELTLMTNPQGESMFYLSSALETTATYSAWVDGLELKQHPQVTFIDASLGGNLIKGKGFPAIYLVKDGKRMVFPNQSVFDSYYNDFSTVNEMELDQLAQYPLRGVVAMRPGTLIKLRTVPKVYRIGQNNQINWIETESSAMRMYGPNWASLVHDIDDVYFTQYTEGASLQ